MRFRILGMAFALGLMAPSASVLASGGSPMGGGPIGGGTPRSPESQAVEFYNQGIHEVGKARDYEQDAKD